MAGQARPARPWSKRRRLSLMLAGLSLLVAQSALASVPGIRISGSNAVPQCVTPQRLMDFLKAHNSNLAQRFSSIANLYKSHGEKWRVRWDYAFFQMAVETNFLQFRKANGLPGDVSITQNNFAGLGATGGGVPGDRYPDVSSGVLAQIQHLVVYSGERVPQPTGFRTRLKQDDILHASAKITARRPVNFQDLAGRWAADRSYGRTISAIANRFFASHCAEGRRAEASRVKQRDAADSNSGGDTPQLVQPQTLVSRQAVSGWLAPPKDASPDASHDPAPAATEIRASPSIPSTAPNEIVPREGNSTELVDDARVVSKSIQSERQLPQPSLDAAGRWAAPAIGQPVTP